MVVTLYLLLAANASAATITNYADSDCIVSGKTVTVYVKPGVETNHNDWCYLNVYKEDGTRVFHEEKEYTNMDSEIKFSISSLSSGKYTIKAGTFYYYTQTNPITFVNQTLTSDSGKMESITITAASGTQIKANKPEVSLKTNGSGKVRLTITGLGDSYDVYRATSLDGTYTKIGTTKSNKYTDSKAGQKTYYYKVKGKTSTYSTKTSAAVKINARITAVTPKFKLELDNDSKVAITVTSLPASYGYMIYRATSLNGTYKLIKTTKSTAFTDTSVSDRTYYYKVKPYVVIDGKKLVGNFTSAKKIQVNDPNKPGKPVLSIGTYYYENGVAKQGAVLAKFDKVENATAYKLYVSRDGGKTYTYTNDGWFIYKASNTEETSVEWCVLFGSAFSGKEYYYKLAAVSDNYQNGEYENFSDPVSYVIP